MKAKAARARRNDPLGLRARILDAAASLFQTRGYHATGMRDVMEAATITSGALHHHFPTKQALALAVISDRVAPVVRETWIEPIRVASSLSGAIVQIFSEIARGIEQRKSVVGCPLNNLTMELSFSNPQFRSSLRSLFEEWQSALAERIGATPGGARLDRTKRAAAAAFVIAAYSGAMNLAKATQSAAPLRAAAGNLSTWLDQRRFNE
ncbi:MAG TPA: helix-turn-helix domain-containing protein [Steroidobacteraceae bacterium]|nr:helix-turn-helix domain-containing protein [Steroidobacteraceae bacterium]